MNFIQSISVVVPTKACVNNCKFCVSRMHDNPYEKKFDEIAYRKRIKRASIEHVSTMIITGTGEALQNIPFLRKLRIVLDKEGHPFPNVELQTSGVMLMKSELVINSFNKEEYTTYPNVEILKELGVNTISLSVSDIFNGKNNWDIIGAPASLRVELDELCEFIKQQGFNLRLSLNMTSAYDTISPEDILAQCKLLGADQVTFRKLYGGGLDNPESKWVDANACGDHIIDQIDSYIGGNWDGDGFGNEWRNDGEGKAGYKLPFGAWVFSINGMSVAIDNDCMSKEKPTETLKYVILRENGKLYWAWDDEGSLIF